MHTQEVIQATRHWVERVVVGLNLCPFAGRELVNDRIRFTVSNAQSEEHLLLELHDELRFLLEDNSIETTLLIIPEMLNEFYAFNDFLELVDGLILQMQLEGIFQVATFHPDYQFDGTEADEVENFTNRSPHPILHLLREASVQRAIQSHPDIDSVPIRNQRLMHELGSEHMRALLQSCMTD